MTFIRKLTSLFKKAPTEQQSDDAIVFPNIRYRITIVDFQDNVESSSGENTSKILQSFPEFDIYFYDEPFNKSFLDLESRNFFDLIDKGQSIIDRTQADVLIWGCRDHDRIRLNFQTDQQYEKSENTFISLLDSLYLPAELFNDADNFPPAIKKLLHGAIISSIHAQNNASKIHKKYLLKKDINLLSKDNSAKQLAIYYMPYIMNFLGIIYLSYSYDAEDNNDYKITLSLFETAIKHQDLLETPLHLGCIYYHLGQLNDCAGLYQKKYPTKYFKDAIKNYHQAQRYLGKYTYPYDYGYISYKLSHLLFNYWKQKEDIQALRDAVSQLREVEKIFSYSQFPDFWAEIQGELGHLLSILGNLTNNKDICLLAINSYRNQQKIITEKRAPLIWGNTQENIGNIYYKIGSEHSNPTYLEDALECFHDALYIYENASQKEKIKQILIAITKTDTKLKTAQ